MYNSGVHATIAGVAMGLMLRCTRREGEQHSPGEHIEHLVRPLSAGLAVPLFALFSAGVGPCQGGALARRLHPAGDARGGPGTGHRQDRRHLRRHLAGRPLHQGRAQPGPRLAGRPRRRHARRNRLHRLAAHRRTRLHRRPGAHRRGEGGGAVRLAASPRALRVCSNCASQIPFAVPRSRSATRTTTASPTSTSRTSPSTTCGWPRSTRRRRPSTAARRNGGGKER